MKLLPKKNVSDLNGVELSWKSSKLGPIGERSAVGKVPLGVSISKLRLDLLKNGDALHVSLLFDSDPTHPRSILGDREGDFAGIFFIPSSGVDACTGLDDARAPGDEGGEGVVSSALSKDGCVVFGVPSLGDRADRTSHCPKGGRR